MIKFITKNKYHLLSIFSIFILFILYHSKLFLNISTALSDWYDYPLMVYIIQENIKHISTLDFANIGNISMYFNSPGGMYFTDLLLPQSVLALFIYPFTEDFITTHNIVFFIVGLLNIISVQYFWNKLFKNKKIVFLLTLLFTFSPYVFTMNAHYQMVSYWFFFFSLGKLITAKSNNDYLVSGLLSGLQFLAAVYLGIYSLTISGLFFIWKYIAKTNYKFGNPLKKLINKKNIYLIFREGILFLIGFIIIAGYFVFKFSETQRVYNIQRSASDFVNHSMQITDYFFNPLHSVWVENFYYKINVNNHRIGGETFGTGFIFLIFSIFGFFKSFKNKLSKQQKYLNGLIILISLAAFIATLGPRLSINGTYLGIPLPYIFPLKLTPFFSALRVVSRWFFVVQIGFIYFIGHALIFIFNKFSLKKSMLIISLITVFYAIEIVPIKQRTSIEEYKSYSYNYLINNCKSNEVVIEYPFAPEQPKTNILVTLNYWTKMILNLMHYDCQLVNGYSGYQPEHIDEYIHNFRTAVENSDTQSTQTLLNNKQVKYIKFNKSMMINESITNVDNQFTTENYNVLLDDSEYLLVMVK